MSHQNRRRRTACLAAAAAIAVTAGVTMWTAPAQAVTKAAAQRVTAAAHPGPSAIVALGDSAISGEGAGTDTNDNYIAPTDGPTNYCHRSAKSVIFDTGLPGVTPIDLACSGAQTGDLTSLAPYSSVTGPGGGDFGEAKQDVQLAAVAAADNVKMVVVQIGANDDFDFTGIMESCIQAYFPVNQPKGCRDTIGTAEINRRAAAIQPKVTAALQDIRQTMRNAGYADSDYQLVYQSYYTPITPDLRKGIDNYAGKVANGCPGYTEDGAWGHNMVVPVFDNALRTAAEQVPGVRFLDDRRVSYGHEVCAEWTSSPYEYTNGDVIDTSELARNGCDKVVLLGVICMNEIRQSYHPRVAGYMAEGACLNQFYTQPSQAEAYCTLNQQDGTSIRPLTQGQPWNDAVDDGAWFQITSKANGNVLDFSGGGSDGDSTNGRPLITYPATGGLNESFVMEVKSNGSYEVDFSGNRAMCLDATGGHAAAGVKLEQWWCSGNNSPSNQRFVFKPQSGGYYSIVSDQDGTLAATVGASKDGGGNPVVELQPYTGAAAQLWKLTLQGIVYLHG